MRKHVLFLFVFLMTFPASAEWLNGYCYLDSVSYVGVEIHFGRLKDNCARVRVNTGKEILTLTPDSVRRYGNSFGAEFKSRTIPYGGDSLLVFAKKEYEGDYSLCVYENEKERMYYLCRNDTSAGTLLRNVKNAPKYRSQLAGFFNLSPEDEAMLQQVQFRASSLVNLIQWVEQSKTSPIARFRWGAVNGYTRSRLKPVSAQNKSQQIGYSYDWESGFSAGLVASIPFNLNATLQAELRLSQGTFSSSTGTSTLENYVSGDWKTLDIPLLFRYCKPVKPIRLYLEGGGLYSKTLQQDIEHVSLVRQGTAVYWSDTETYRWFEDDYWGLAVGCGIEAKLGRTCLLEVGYRMYNRKVFDRKELNFQKNNSVETSDAALQVVLKF